MANQKGIVLLLLVGVSFAFSACQPPTSSASRSTNSLIVPDYQFLSSHNPMMAETTMSAWLTELIYDGLVKFDDTLQIQPNLAVAWKLSNDKRVWTFYLRKGVKFHDGVELTAEDVKFTLDQLKEPNMKTTYSYNMNEVEEVLVKDRYILEIRLKNVVAPFLSDLIMGILPKHLSSAMNTASVGFSPHPIGTGPFEVVVSSETGTVLQANNDYFAGRPMIDRVVVKVYNNQETAWSALMRGGGDLFWHLNSREFQQLRQIPSFHLYSVMKPYYYLLAFNMKNTVFGDQRVRQALNYAIDKEALIQKVFKGYGKVLAGSIYPNSWAYNSELKPYPYDPQKALALLKDAGWQDHDGDHLLDRHGQPFEFVTFTNRGDDLKQQVLLIVQRQLSDLGIKMDVKLFDATDTSFLFTKEFEAHFPEMDAGGDPDLNYKFWHSSQIRDGFNVGSYRNAKVDRLLEAGRRSFNQDERKTIYYRFQQELHDDPPGIFLFWTDYLVGVNERFKGVKISPAGPFANIRQWYVDGDQQHKS